MLTSLGGVWRRTLPSMETDNQLDWYLLECGHYGWRQHGMEPSEAKDGHGGREAECRVCPREGPLTRRRVVAKMPYGLT